MVPQARYRPLFSLANDFFSSHLATLRLAGLLGILLLSFWAGMTPHWDYIYPLHVDEWFAIGFAQSTVDAGALDYPNPYGPGEVSLHAEMGFHLLLGFVKTVTGLSWLDLYRFAPGVLMASMAFLTYSFGRRAGFGWSAALFVSLIPTSVRILGPAFVVPVTAAMLFIPVTLLVLHTMEERGREKSMWLLTLFVVGAIFAHPPTGVAVTGLVGLYLMGFYGEALVNRRYGAVARLLLADVVRISIPAIILGLWLPSLSRDALEQLNIGASGSASTLGLLSGFTGAFGIAGVIVFVIGLFVFIARGDFGVRSYMLIVFTGLILFFLVFLFPAYGFGPDILYRRSWLYLGLLMAIFAGYGVGLYFRSIPAIAEGVATRFRNPMSDRTAGALWAVGAATIAVVVITSLVSNKDREAFSGYYHVIDDQVFTDFRWIGQHTAPDQTVVMGEPTIAWAYPPVAGSGATVFEAVADPFTTSRAERLRQMLSLGEADIPWLNQAGISVYYSCLPIFFTCREMTNIDMFKVRRGVYLIPDPADK